MGTNKPTVSDSESLCIPMHLGQGHQTHWPGGPDKWCRARPNEWCMVGPVRPTDLASLLPPAYQIQHIRSLLQLLWDCTSHNIHAGLVQDTCYIEHPLWLVWDTCCTWQLPQSDHMQRREGATFSVGPRRARVHTLWGKCPRRAGAGACAWCILE